MLEQDPYADATPAKVIKIGQTCGEPPFDGGN